MILDTTYLLPLAQIDIDTDLLSAVAGKRVDLKLEDITISLISVFELQAKAAKLNIPVESVVKATTAILNAFRIEPFHRTEIIKASHELRKTIPDYLDCVVVATAIVSRGDLVTEDSLILARTGSLEKQYGIKVVSFKDIMK